MMVQGVLERPVPLAALPAVDEELKCLVQRGVLIPGPCSKSATAIVIVGKANGTLQ
ncbi:hypothetical protein ACTXT7_004487 [Hymenolepis weldensis]